MAANSQVDGRVTVTNRANIALEMPMIGHVKPYLMCSVDSDESGTGVRGWSASHYCHEQADVCLRQLVANQIVLSCKDLL